MTQQLASRFASRDHVNSSASLMNNAIQVVTLIRGSPNLRKSQSEKGLVRALSSPSLSVWEKAQLVERENFRTNDPSSMVPRLIRVDSKVGLPPRYVSRSASSTATTMASNAASDAVGGVADAVAGGAAVQAAAGAGDSLDSLIAVEAAKIITY
jgi:hypothetical protein